LEWRVRQFAPSGWGNPPDPQNEEALESETQVVRGYTATTRGWQATNEESILRLGIIVKL